MSVTKEQVIEFIAGMTVLELSELIKELEDKFGVSAAAPAAAVMAMPAAAAARLAQRQPPDAAERLLGHGDHDYRSRYAGQSAGAGAGRDRRGDVVIFGDL